MHDKSSEQTGATPSSSSNFSDRSAAPAELSHAYVELSGAELDLALQRLLTAPAEKAAAADELQRLVHELQVHRCELEMQNRALRETQQALEGAVHRYVDLYDSLPIGYVTLTRDGRIEEANQTVADMLGLPRERLAGTFLRRFLAEADGPRLPPYLETCAQCREPKLLEVTLQPPASAAIHVQISGRRADAAHSGELIRAALTDVTVMKNAQQALQDVVAEQENFAYSISHDLRAPLLTIRGFASILTEETESFSPEQLREILGRIYRAGARMDELLLGLLEYARVSRSPVTFGPVDISDVVKNVLVQHRATITASGANIEVTEPLPVALGSTILLDQVISNLLTNALKYAPKGTPPVVRISGRTTERTVIITFTDEGIGIAPQQHERIFRIFERLHGLSTYPGTGIGLALVRRAVERMHGRVWVESEEGKGARFHLELPR